MARITEVTQAVTDLYSLLLLIIQQHSKQNRTLTISLRVYYVPPGKEEGLTPFVVISIYGQVGEEAQNVSKQLLHRISSVIW